MHLGTYWPVFRLVYIPLLSADFVQFADRFGSGFGKTLVNLTILDLSYNKLTELSACFGDLQKLTSLTLSNNELQTAPKEIAELRGLEILDLSHNSLQSLPPTFFGALVALLKLDLSHNNLDYIPSSIGGCTPLNWLQLSVCQHFYYLLTLMTNNFILFCATYTHTAQSIDSDPGGIGTARETASS